MYIIGENIHIMSDKVKAGIKERDAAFFQKLATAQVEAGAAGLLGRSGRRRGRAGLVW